MTVRVVTAYPGTPFKELARLMHEHAVSGLPVVDGDGRVVGIVTEADLLSAGEEREQPPSRRHRFLEWFIDPLRLAGIERRAPDLRARDVMTRDVVNVTPETSVTEAIRTLLDAGVKRLPVTAGAGTLVGIVSRHDLLTPVLRPDEDIRREIVDEVVFHTMWIDPATVRVRVENGVVHLEGQLERRSVKELLVEFVERVDGVVAVDAERLGFAKEDRDIRIPPAFGRPAWGENWVARR